MLQRQKCLLAAAMAVLLVVLTTPLRADQLKGKIAGVNPEKNEFVITENFKNWTFLLDRSGQVVLNGRECKLAELQSGDEALVTFTRSGERLVASVVRCMRK